MLTAMTIKLVASDLDGTLFGSDSVPEPRTVAAVNAVIDAGYTFVAVTGRSYFGGAERVTSTGANVPWFIGSNGGHRFNITTGQLEERLVFTSTELASILDRVSAEIDGLGMAFEHAAGFTYDPTFVRNFPQSFDGGKRVDTAVWANDDVGKVFVSHADLNHDKLIELTTPLVPAGTHVTTSGTTFIEFTPAGADKALALGRLCDQLGVAQSEVVAFGDNNNDVSMLQWAGRGVAMENATDQAKAAADEVTLTNVDFGVAEVLETLL